ncbi:MAG: COX15/CtaA family protein [Bdellovibrionia bacterium]
MHVIAWIWVLFIYGMRVLGVRSIPGWRDLSFDFATALTLELGSLLIFSASIAMACRIQFSPLLIPEVPGKMARLARAGLLSLILQFTMACAMRTWNAGLSCPNFPLCSETFLPRPWTLYSALAWTHRWWGVLLLGLFFHLALLSARKAPLLAGVTRRAFGLSVAQIFLGIGTVLSGLHPDSRTLHSAVGWALWGLLFFVALRSGGVNLSQAPIFNPQSQRA